MTDVPSASVWRYTALPSLISILKYRQLTLLDPSSWDDKNDSQFLLLYREKKRLKSVLALCFTQASQTYHHWRVFAPGSSGVCLEIDRAQLEESAKKVPGTRVRDVDYWTLPVIRRKTLRTEQLPFVKRSAFRPESEVRLLWESRTVLRTSTTVPLELKAIRRITLSPWLHASLATDIKDVLRSIEGCGNLPVFRSTLTSNAEWVDFGRSAM